MDHDRSRRGFINDLLTWVASGWVALAAFAGLTSTLSSGCSDTAVKYGPPLPGPDAIAVKYGVPVYDARPETIAVKYGVPFYDAKVEVGAAPKYGIKTDTK